MSSARVGGRGAAWFDVRASMMSLEEVHKVRVWLEVMCDLSAPGSLILSLNATPIGSLESPATLQDARHWVSQARWPTYQHRSVEGAVYSTLLKLDWILSRERWAQMEMPEPPA